MMKQIETPSHASWESTLGCPLRCKHCGLDASRAKSGEMTTEEAAQMLISLNRFGIENLIISGGEFTFRKDWREILRRALPLFNSVRVITCGWLGEKLFSHLEEIDSLGNLLVSVSLDGLEKEHNFRRGSGSFRSVMETLSYKTTIPRTVLMTVDSHNIHDVPKVIELCLQLEMPLISLQISLPAGRMDPALFLGQKAIINLAEQIERWQVNYQGRIRIVPDDCFANLFPIRNLGPWSGCYAGRKLITILSDGAVTGCPTMSEITGNIKEQDLKEIWLSTAMEKIRSSIPNECAVCGQCPGGCQAVSKIFKQQFCLTT